MKILVVHNRYRERTGEDSVFDREVNLLEENGHNVSSWTVDNRNIQTKGIFRNISLAKNTVWSRISYFKALKKIQDIKPDIVHVHNTLPILSPAIFYACSRSHVPVIHTLHNYRLICPSTSLFRSGKICEKCVSQSLIHSVRYACYRDSHIQTAAVAAMLEYHRRKGTWSNKVDGYIALSEFQKSKLSYLGIPADRIHIKPNFIERVPRKSDISEFGLYYLFVGRLIDEKGIQLLIDGYQNSGSTYPLVIIGSGYLKDKVIEAARTDPKIKYMGSLQRSEVLKWMSNAIALLFTSVWYECSPMTILEAFSCSLPVVSTRLGSVVEMVKHEATGYVFSPPTPTELSDAIRWVEADSLRWTALKKNLLSGVDSKCFKTENYNRLLEIYNTVVNQFNDYRSKEKAFR